MREIERRRGNRQLDTAEHTRYWDMRLPRFDGCYRLYRPGGRSGRRHPLIPYQRTIQSFYNGTAAATSTALDNAFKIVPKIQYCKVRLITSPPSVRVREMMRRMQLRRTSTETERRRFGKSLSIPLPQITSLPHSTSGRGRRRAACKAAFPFETEGPKKDFFGNNV